MQAVKFFFIFLLLSGCLFQKHEGVMLHHTDIEKIHKGQTAKEVINILGSPSFILNEADEEWFYVSSKKEWRAFFEPKITEHSTLRIKIKNGTVADINMNDDLPDKSTPQPKTKIKQPKKPK